MTVAKKLVGRLQRRWVQMWRCGCLGVTESMEVWMGLGLDT